MKVFLKRDTGDECARYEIFDACGSSIGRIRGKCNPSGESMRISGADGNTLCRVRRLGFDALSAYVISVGGQTFRLSISGVGGRAAVRFRGISFCIRGDVLSGSYDIIDADKTVVCAVYKDYAAAHIQLTVNMEERQLLCIAAAACIDSLRLGAAPAVQLT